MQSTPLVLVPVVLLAISVLILWVKSILWTGRDARRRGFRHAGWIQLLTVLQFPWPWLAYWLITRELDRRALPARS